MNNKLFISGEIDSGWTRIVIESGQISITLRTSYIFDGLTNLLSAVSLLNNDINETEASLIDEPYEHIIHFIKNNDQVTINVFTFDNFSGRPLSDRMNQVLKPNFIFNTTLKRLKTQVTNLFDYFRQTYGLEGYQDKWRHMFPSDKLNNLRK